MSSIFRGKIKPIHFQHEEFVTGVEGVGGNAGRNGEHGIEVGDEKEIEDCRHRIWTHPLRGRVGALGMAQMNRDPVPNFLKNLK